MKIGGLYTEAQKNSLTGRLILLTGGIDALYVMKRRTKRFQTPT